MVEAFLEYLSSERRYSTRTRSAYEDDLKKYVVYLQTQFEELNICQADTMMLRSYVVYLSEQGLAESSIHRMISSLKSFYKYALREGAVEQNPAYKLPLPKLKKRLPVFVDKSRIIALLQEGILAENVYDYACQLIPIFFYASGIRLSELIGLKEFDVDTQGRAIKVLGKRNKDRIVPIPSFLCELVENYRYLKTVQMEGKMGCDAFFVNKKGNAFSMSAVYTIVKKCLRSHTTLEKCSPHVLRHTYATQLLNEGADLNAVKELLGHTSLAATQVYTHNSIEKLKKSYMNAHPRA